ncbi:hypothetical protein [Paracidovorax wautersii]|uniref:Uncharacterized protein n=1 Tax=Paracidovorax wautersii TaxID=1177982 RepID=A0ABU1IG98_9BURK|nr:hypothetical protein [Paracidovorax wautersii]MDR6215991.1 hypothetical protein [Paracidovorax wautersii]
MKNKAAPQVSLIAEDYYVMRIADLLSDDPLLVQVIGKRFKLIASCDRERRRVTYQFRHVDDVEADEASARWL